ncbi:hypothetical protein JCM5296_002074 [Sporobolomyces johnsonii]
MDPASSSGLPAATPTRPQLAGFRSSIAFGLFIPATSIPSPTHDSPTPLYNPLDDLAKLADRERVAKATEANAALRDFTSSPMVAHQNGFTQAKVITSSVQRALRTHHSAPAIPSIAPAPPPLLAPLSPADWDALAAPLNLRPRCFQTRTVDALLSGKDAIVLAPTGRGKSLLWTLPLLRDSDGLVIVVVPLVALGKSQEARSKAAGLRCLFCHGKSPSDLFLTGIVDGHYQQLVMTYEFLTSPGFVELLANNSTFSARIRFFAFDEAHFLVEAAHYRPVMLTVGMLRRWLRRRIPFLATTATALPSYLDTLESRLDIHYRDAESCFFINLGTRRPEIRTWIGAMKDSLKKGVRDVEFLISPDAASPDGIPSTIIYSDDCSHLSALHNFLRTRLRNSHLSPDLVSVAYSYLSESTLAERYAAFENGAIRILLCTEVYGAGGNPPNVRRVVQWGAGRVSAAQLVQRKGRAGRDGEEAHFFLFVEKSMREGATKRSMTQDKIKERGGFCSGMWRMIGVKPGEGCVEELEAQLFRSPPALGILDPNLCACGRCYAFDFATCRSFCCDPSAVPPPASALTRNIRPGSLRMKPEQKEQARIELERWREKMWTGKWRELNREDGLDRWFSDKNLTLLAQGLGAYARLLPHS